MGLTALTAATFCVFLTLELPASFLTAAFRASGLDAVRRDLAAGLAFAATFFAAARTGLRAVAFAAGARFALGLVEDFAWTARFAVFADDFALERDVDRLNPFVRLLLMADLKRLLTFASSRGNAWELITGRPLNQRAQVFAGALRSQYWTNPRHMYQQRKTLEGHCWLCYSASWLTEA